MQKWVQIISSFLQKLEGFKLKSNVTTQRIFT